jgi:hypothetical protein
MNPERVALNHLSGAFRACFKRLAQHCREFPDGDAAGYWVNLIAAGLSELRLVWPPVVDQGQPILPFVDIHRLTTEVFRVGGGGLRGGPTVDVLLQIWFETESMNAAFGLPLLLRPIASNGPVSQLVWEELREAARDLNQFTPSGRILLIGHPDPFQWETMYGRVPTDLYVLSTVMAAGMTTPPRGMSGRILEHFDYDLASGWIGDPALAGDASSSHMASFLSHFDVAHLLRIRIRKDTP